MKKKKKDQIKKAFSQIVSLCEEGKEEYLKFKKGNMSAAARARANLMEIHKMTKDMRKMIQDKKNKKIAKKG